MSRAEASVIVAKAFHLPVPTGCYSANCGAGFPNNFFLDIQAFWQGPYIRALWNSGLINGTAPNRFDPDRSITRAELTKIIMRAHGFKK